MKKLSLILLIALSATLLVACIGTDDDVPASLSSGSDKSVSAFSLDEVSSPSVSGDPLNAEEPSSDETESSSSSEDSQSSENTSSSDDGVVDLPIIR